MSATPSQPAIPAFPDVIVATFNAILSIVKGIADAITANAELLGTVILVTTIGYAVFRFGRRVFDLFKGLIPF